MAPGTSDSDVEAQDPLFPRSRSFRVDPIAVDPEEDPFHMPRDSPRHTFAHENEEGEGAAANEDEGTHFNVWTWAASWVTWRRTAAQQARADLASESDVPNEESAEESHALSPSVERLSYNAADCTSWEGEEEDNREVDLTHGCTQDAVDVSEDGNGGAGTRTGSADENAAKKSPEKPSQEKCSPEERATWLSMMLFLWVTPIMKVGNTRSLEQDDLWKTAKVDSGGKVVSAFRSIWVKECSRGVRKPSMARALLRTYFPQLVLTGLVKLVYDILLLSSPIYLRAIVKTIESAPSGHLDWVIVRRGCLLAGALLVNSLAQTFILHNYFFRVYRVGMHVKTGLIGVIYDKALHMGSSARSSLGTGTLVNLMSNDAEKLCSMCTYLHMVWSGPFQIIVALIMLVLAIGPLPAAAGVLAMLLLLPVNGIILYFLAKVRARLMTATDERVKTMTEVLNGIKAIKLYAWEQPFAARILRLRNEELKHVRNSIFLESLDIIFFSLSPILVGIATFAVFTLQGRTLTAAIAFPVLSIFNLLRFPLSILPDQIVSMVQAFISLTRIQSFLYGPDLEQTARDSSLNPGAVVISNGSFAWDMEVEDKDVGSHGRKQPLPISSFPSENGLETPLLAAANRGGHEENAAGEDETVASRRIVLRDISLTVEPGKLVIVVGEVGSGKSSLLAAILGEMEKVSGDVRISGSLAYTAQDPWIRNATLRDNILMGRDFNEDRYNKVVACCALERDTGMIPGGEWAEIGEKGINLSGGQKHRVALARAAYGKADLILLDDPLSAVDVHVGKHLFEECISSLMGESTRILVTHQLQYLSAADLVVIMQQGVIHDMGTYTELLGRGVDFHNLGVSEDESGEGEDVGDHNPSGMALNPNGTLSGGEQGATLSTNTSSQQAGDTLQSTLSRGSRVSIDSLGRRSSTDVAERDLAIAGTVSNGEATEFQAQQGSDLNNDGSLIEAELRSHGIVSKEVYLAYIKAMGGGTVAFFVIMVMTYVAAATCRTGMDAWLAYWVQAIKSDHALPVKIYLLGYSAFGIGFIVLVFLESLFSVIGAVAASRKIHAKLLEHCLRLPMAFFDTQPSGRLLNRFTRDTEKIDVSLPVTLDMYISCIVAVSSSIILITIATPPFLVVAVPLYIVYSKIQLFYINAARELKRLDSLARSPIFSHFAETVQGLPSVRAFGMQRAFEEDNIQRIEASNRAYFAQVTSSRWLAVRLEVLGAAIVYSTATLSMFAGGAYAGFAGLAISTGLSVTGILSWMVRVAGDLENEMNSCERVQEYLKLDTEPPAIIPDSRPPAAWPSKGGIVVRKLYVRYRPTLPPVLHNLSFTVHGGEKIGVCGRTGCGKTTLMMTLFRIVEPCGGNISIDNVDICAIGIQDLRSRLALVPQDPVVFSGTIRSNLDPFNEADGDMSLWDALRQAGVARAVQDLEGGLDAPITEGGSNLSTGQRQLLCMARALLRHAKILILDEATSNVDHATDNVIQTTIRTAFADRTVLTIAHRINTIMDCTRILVLDAGRRVEMDKPSLLLENESSAFSGLVRQAKSLTPED